MKKKLIVFVLSTLVFLSVLSGCGFDNSYAPNLTTTLPNTPTITPTFTSPSTATNTPTLPPTITPTFISTPLSDCSLGATAQDTIDYSLPGFVDIISASTDINSNFFTVIFTLREIPEKIDINQNHIRTRQAELGWGVGIDIDNNPDTGGRLITGIKEKHGYDKALTAKHYKNGTKYTNEIQRIFTNEVLLLDKIVEKGYFSGSTKGLIVVDLNAKTITLKVIIKDITPYSRFYFFSFYQSASKAHTDELCDK